MPGGIMLRVFAPFEYEDPQRDGSTKTVKAWRPIPSLQFSVKGPYKATAGQAYQQRNSAVMELLPGGYALTYGVPKETWDRWYEQNKNTQLVTKRVIFASPSLPQATVDARTDEARKVKSGLEPIDPDNLAARIGGGARGLKVTALDENEPGTLSR
jgi:hypothetical protein